jgi:hypothetical protein
MVAAARQAQQAQQVRGGESRVKVGRRVALGCRLQVPRLHRHIQVDWPVRIDAEIVSGENRAVRREQNGRQGRAGWRGHLGIQAPRVERDGELVVSRGTQEIGENVVSHAVAELDSVDLVEPPVDAQIDATLAVRWPLYRATNRERLV